MRVLQNERNRLEEEKTEAEGETDDLRNDLAKWKERDVAATLNRNNQVEAANARVAELEKELAECGKVGEEPKLPKGEKTMQKYRATILVCSKLLLP